MLKTFQQKNSKEDLYIQETASRIKPKNQKNSYAEYSNKTKTYCLIEPNSDITERKDTRYHSQESHKMNDEKTVQKISREKSNTCETK